VKWIPLGTRGYGGGIVSLVAVPQRAPDQTVYAGRADGELTRIDILPGETRHRVQAHDGPVWGMCWAVGADGEDELVSAGADGIIRTWSPESLTPLWATQTHSVNQVRALHSFPFGSGQLVAAATGHGEIHLWDTASRQQVAVVNTGHSAPVRALESWSPAPGLRVLAAASGNGEVSLWDVTTLTPVREPLLGHGAPVLTLHAFLGGNGAQLLASASDDGTVRLWAVDGAGLLEAPLVGHNAPVRVITSCASGDGGGPFLITGGDDGTLRLWDTDLMAPAARVLPVGRGQVRSVAQLPTSQGAQIAFGGGSGKLHLVALSRDAVPEAPLQGHVASVLTLTAIEDEDGTVSLLSGGDDGTIRHWDPGRGVSIGSAIRLHSGPVRSIAGQRTAQGVIHATSGGDDGKVFLWSLGSPEPARSFEPGLGPVLSLAFLDLEDRRFVACAGGDGRICLLPLDNDRPPTYLSGHSGPVRSILALPSHGPGRLLSAGDDGTIRLWEAGRRNAAIRVVNAHEAPVRVLHEWSRSSGSLIVSGSTDKTVRIWDVENRRRAMPVEFARHQGTVLALASWVDSDGRNLIASAGTDRVIRVWDLFTGSEVATPMRGHTDTIWALTCWSSIHGDVVLASAGEDGMIRLWDASMGDPLAALSVGPTALWAMSDVAAEVDLLDREVLAGAVAEQLLRSIAGRVDMDEGPAVVTVEGLWGAGKTTFMKMVERRLGGSRAQPVPSGPRLTLREAARGARKLPTARESASRDAGVVTAWFNPWTHQSDEEVWAGLANTIITAAATVLYPDDKARERYWFRHNQQKLDRYALRRTVRRRSISPLLGVGLVTGLLPVVLNLAGLSSALKAFGWKWDLGPTAALLALLLLLIGVIHTVVRYMFGKAASYLPSELFNGPLGGATSSLVTTGRSAPDSVTVKDPVLTGKAGSLHLLRHGIDRVLADLRSANSEFVLFVDDLDRCSTRTTARVFEGINLFLSGGNLRGRFVVGLDPSVVARRLDVYYRDFDTSPEGDGDDVGSGWDFLRKFVQLPVRLPAVSDGSVRSFVDEVLRTSSNSNELHESPASVGQQHQSTRATVRGYPAAKADSPLSARGPGLPSGKVPAVGPVVDAMSLESHTRMKAFIAQRLYAQPERSIREAKRMLNVWQLYARVMDVVDPLRDAGDALARGMRLVVLAEIVTRWPALQERLHRRFRGVSGLHILAVAASDEDEWLSAVLQVRVDREPSAGFGGAFQVLLRDNDGVAVAELAALLL
jgi:WD40 repeat protein